MKSMKTVVTGALFLLGVAASGAALAAHVGVGINIGIPLYAPAPYYYYPPYYYPPVPYANVAVPPPTYIIQNPAPVVTSQPQGYWYYCTDSKAYYPYVKECPSGWQRVTPQPPPAP